jgi:DNA polymerase-3 subunit gamma/tau
MNRIPKALLIDGIRGVGKTTIARLYAGAINCSSFQEDLCLQCASCQEFINKSHPSIFEFDAASHNGVDDIRGLEELCFQQIGYPYKVFILDEAHMLTKQAQAAFLKLLEEPPPNTLFILVTTDPNKLDRTIGSRCLSLPLHPLSDQDISDNLRGILELEGFSVDDHVLTSINNTCEGSLRDAQQMLDRLIISSTGNYLSSEGLAQLPGFITLSQYTALASVLLLQDQKFALQEVDRWYKEGWDLSLLFKVGIPNLLRDFMVCLSGAYNPEINYLSGLSHDALRRNLSLTASDIKRITKEWEGSVELMQELHPKIVFALFLTKIF